MKINDDGSVVAQRTDDEGAVAVLPADYLQNSAQLGYAGTIHSAQGATADTMHCLLDVMTAQKEMSYVAATRGREANHIYLFERVAGDAAEQHRPTKTGKDERCWRGTDDEARDGLVSVMTRSSSDATAAEALESDADRVQLDHQTERIDRDRELGNGRAHSTVGEQT